MGETVFHLAVPVREALAADDATLAIFFSCEDGREPAELRTELVIRLAKGHRWAPLCACSNFDPASGCLGHERGH